MPIIVLLLPWSVIDVAIGLCRPLLLPHSRYRCRHRYRRSEWRCLQPGRYASDCRGRAAASSSSPVVLLPAAAAARGFKITRGGGSYKNTPPTLCNIFLFNSELKCVWNIQHVSLWLRSLLPSPCYRGAHPLHLVHTSFSVLQCLAFPQTTKTARAETNKTPKIFGSHRTDAVPSPRKLGNNSAAPAAAAAAMAGAPSLWSDANRTGDS